MATLDPNRKPYHGSCHCGFTRYILFLTLPPSTSWVGAEGDGPTGMARVYKCNCTVCHKTGFFHVRPAFGPKDFMLLCPLDLKDLNDYTCMDKELHWYFCPKCGVRCFIFCGEGEVVDVNLGEIGAKEGVEGMTKVWKPKAEGWSSKTSYLSVNGYTLDQGQDGVDLREWTEKKLVGYVETWFEKGDDTLERPHNGGAY